MPPKLDTPYPPHLLQHLQRVNSPSPDAQPSHVSFLSTPMITLTIYRRTVKVVRPEKLGPKHLYICSVFRRFRDIMANTLWTKRDIDNRAMALESTKGPLHCPKISWTLVHKRLKTGPEFLPPHYFVPSQSIAHPLSGINVAPHSDSK